INFAAQLFITGACAIEKFRPELGVQLDGRVIKPLDLAPAFRSHFAASPLISRKSQTFAIFQSRITVSGDTSSTCAVSFTLNPPKNLNSTTRLFRESTLA